MRRMIRGRGSIPRESERGWGWREESRGWVRRGKVGRRVPVEDVVGGSEVDLHRSSIDGKVTHFFICTMGGSLHITCGNIL